MCKPRCALILCQIIIDKNRCILEININESADATSVTDKALSWFSSYLKERTQRVKIGPDNISSVVRTTGLSAWPYYV